MNFIEFKEFRGVADGVISYLKTDLKKILKELQLGLTKLRFTENFEAFEIEVTIAAGAELKIRNQIRSGTIPSQRLIIRGGSGSQNIVDGDTEWTREHVYLKNTGASAATATVLFVR